MSNKNKLKDGEESKCTDLFGQWRPIEDGLPEYMSSCLVWCPLHENAFAAYYYFYSGRNDPKKIPIWAFFDDDGEIKKMPNIVTHWMPMPSPPNAVLSGGACDKATL